MQSQSNALGDLQKVYRISDCALDSSSCCARYTYSCSLAWRYGIELTGCSMSGYPIKVETCTCSWLSTQQRDVANYYCDSRISDWFQTHPGIRSLSNYWALKRLTSIKQLLLTITRFAIDYAGSLCC